MTLSNEYLFTPQALCPRCYHCEKWDRHHGCCVGQEATDIVDEVICVEYVDNNLR